MLTQLNKKGIETFPLLFVQEMPLVWLAKAANFGFPLSLISPLPNGSLARLLLGVSPSPRLLYANAKVSRESDSN